MNMKKTIAAIAAGAVAVSAMATTVSALESKTLSYNLVATLQNQQDGKVTIKATFPNVKLVAGDKVTIKVVSPADSNGWKDKIVVSGQYIDTNKAINPITFTEDEWTEGYNKVAADMMNSWSDAAGYYHFIDIPVKAINDGSPALIGGDAAATEGIEEYLTVVASNGTVATINGAFYKKSGLAKEGTTTLTWKALVPAVPAGDAKWHNDTDAVDLDPTGDATTIATLEALRASTPDVLVYTVAGKTYTYTPATAGKPAVPAGYYDADGKTAADYGIAAAAGTVGDIITINYTAAEAAKDVVTANITVTATMPCITAKDAGTVGAQVTAGKFAISLNGVAGDAGYSGYSAPTKVQAPFMTNYTGNENILWYLENTNTLAGANKDKAYVNATAVINDAIANYDNVTFTFNTAVMNVMSKELVKEDGTKYTAYVYTPNDWEGDAQYKAFGQHLYDWFYAPEGTEYKGYEWEGENLFAGALVVNEALTMSLSETERFDWSATSLSFDWDAIMDGAMTDNDFATYVRSLKLATSRMWFWDSMDLVLTAGEADDVSSDAGTEGDEDTLDTDDDEGADIDADDDADEPADEPAEEPADEPAAAPEVSNPTTGNASVALAVIPVALAAAAVVAKKRG